MFIHLRGLFWTLRLYELRGQMVPFPHSALDSCSFCAPPAPMHACSPLAAWAVVFARVVLPSATCVAYSLLPELCSNALSSSLPATCSLIMCHLALLPPSAFICLSMMATKHYGDTADYILHLLVLLFIPSPTPFPVACSATYRLHDLVSRMAAMLAPDHNRRF